MQCPKCNSILVLDYLQSASFAGQFETLRCLNCGNYPGIKPDKEDPPKQRQKPCHKIMLTYHGETHSLKEWAQITGLHVSTIRSRLVDRKWTIENALGKRKQ